MHTFLASEYEKLYIIFLIRYIIYLIIYIDKGGLYLYMKNNDDLLIEALEDLALMINKNKELEKENNKLRKQIIQEVIKHEQKQHKEK